MQPNADSFKNDSKEIVLADTKRGQPSNLRFPLDFVREKIFLCGVTGSGKSWTAGLLMEEINRVGLQFVCFDVLGAHRGLKILPDVEELVPSKGETVNIKGLVERLKNEPTSFIVDMSDLSLEKQRELIADYSEALLDAKLDKGIMTILEECQDFVPQNGKPISFNGIVRLCKLGRQYGYGVCLISQRPASVSKEALSQCSVYLIHNLINHRDLKAVEDQLGFGTDREQLKKVLSGVASATQGEVVCYSPSYFRDEGFYRASKVRDDRQVPHTRKNIEMKPATHSAQTVTNHPIMDSWDFEMEEETAAEYEPTVLNSESVLSDFSGYKAETPAFKFIDIDDFGASNTENKKTKFESPIVGLALIAVLASGMYVVVNGLDN